MPGPLGVGGGASIETLCADEFVADLVNSSALRGVPPTAMNASPLPIRKSVKATKIRALNMPASEIQFFFIVVLGCFQSLSASTARIGIGALCGCLLSPSGG